MRSLALAFGQMSSAGRLMGQDLLQMINAGFNPLQVISKQTGETMATLKKRMEEGGISAEEVAAAFKSASSEGGQFFNGMQRASETFTGQLSTLKDEAVGLARSFGEVMLPVLKDITQNLTEFAKKFADLDDQQKKNIITFGLVAAAVGPLVVGFGKLVILVPKIAAAIELMKVKMAALNIVMAANPVIMAGAAVAAGIGLVIAAMIKAKNIAEEDSLNRSVSIEDTLENNIVKLKEFERQLDDIRTRTGSQYGGVDPKYLADLERQYELAKNIVDTQIELKEETEETAEQESRYSKMREESQARINKAVDDFIAKQKQAAEDAEQQAADEAARIEKERAVINATQEEIIRRSRNIDSLIRSGIISEAEGIKQKIQMRKDSLELHQRELLEGMHTAEESIRFTRDQQEQILFLKVRYESLIGTTQDLNETQIKGAKDYADNIEEEIDLVDDLTDAIEQKSEAEQDASIISRKIHDDEKAQLSTITSLTLQVSNILSGNFLEAYNSIGDVVLTIGVLTGNLIVTIIGAVIKLQNELFKVGEKFAESAQTIENRSLSISQTIAQTALDNLNTTWKETLRIHNDKMDLLDEEEKAALEKAGHTTKTEEETQKEKANRLKKEIDDLWAAGKRKSAIAKESELSEVNSYIDANQTRWDIEEEFAEKREALLDAQKEAEKNYLNEKSKWEYNLAVANKAIKASEIEIAAAKAISEVPALAFGQKKQVEAQYEVLKELVKSIYIPPPVQLATGGMVMPSPGGTLARLAEAGQPEVVFPLDKLERFIARGMGMGGDSNMMRLQVNLDSKPILEKIFPATRNGTVLISARAVV
jgi:tape measure domain-containing protein